jgi:hypothetical protein
MVHALGAQTQSAEFVKTCFIGQVDFVVWYLVINNGYQATNDFDSKVDAVNLRHI